MNAPELFYGEAPLEAVGELLRHAEARAGERFLDLGSGCGKAVIAAALTHPDLAACAGIELLDPLHAEAQEAGRRYAQLRDERPDLPRVELAQGNFLARDWGDPDIVYGFFTVFPRDLIREIEVELQARLKPGARVVIVSKQLENFGGAFEPMGAVSLPQPHVELNQGGAVSAFVYRKVQ